MKVRKVLIKFYAAAAAVVLSALAAAASVAAVPSDAADVCPIKVGQSLPDLMLRDVEGKTFDLNKAVAKQPTILVFYRGGWCPYCNVHLGELQTIESQLKDLGYQVLAISPDLPSNLKSSVSENKLSYTLLSDANANAIKALGIGFKVDDVTLEKYLGYGINLEKASGESHHILPVPAAIVMGTDGKTEFVFTSPDYKVRVNTKVLLAAAESAVEKGMKKEKPKAAK